jgi:hypothetical protein
LGCAKQQCELDQTVEVSGKILVEKGLARFPVPSGIPWRFFDRFLSGYIHHERL